MGHYSTPLHHAKKHTLFDFREHITGLNGGNQASCKESTCRYIFNSKADEKRHSMLMNHQKKQNV